MGQVRKLHTEDRVRILWRPSPVTLVLGAVGAFFAVLALSALLALFAHPAGASTLPGSNFPSGTSGTSGTPTVGQVSDATQSTVASVASLADVVDSDSGAAGLNATNAAKPAAGPVLALLQTPASALQSVALEIQPVTKAIGSPLGQLVTTLSSVPGPATAITAPLLQPVASLGVAPGTDATTIHLNGTTTGSEDGSPAVGLRLSTPPRLPPRPESPRPRRSPTWPFQSLPLATSSSATGDGSLFSAGSAFAAAPASGPLLPDPPVSEVIPAQGGLPRLLFDLRSSPPG